MASFYQDLVVHSQFEKLVDKNAYTPLPDDWCIGLADIVGSTELIQKGAYKVVNTIGAAVISAQINGLSDNEFPFVFGGDGATFAFPGSEIDQARANLAAVSRWAKDEFDIELRAAIVPVNHVRENGFEVTTARFSASTNVDYAMFMGGGVSYADKLMKQGEFNIPIAEPGTIPDLTGLSCRWTPIESSHGKILSLLIMPANSEDDGDYLKVLEEIVATIGNMERNGHPVPPSGPGYVWPPEGLELEAIATHGKSSVKVKKFLLLIETLIAWFFFKFNVTLKGFDANHYVETSGINADFRKFEDGLKMTLDCNPQQESQLIDYLNEKQREGIIRYGVTGQNAALMTCIVPSVMTDDHMHFIDGEKGGYAIAAMQIKQQVNAE